MAISCSKDGPAKIAVGKSTFAPVEASPEVGPPEVPVPQLEPPASLARAGGRRAGPAIGFQGAVNVPEHLQFFLVIGSDARPGQQIDSARADSIHIVAIDPHSKRGTVLGIPRDSYVDIPGHGQGKINSALALGGPPLLLKALRNLTGLPIEYYAVTAFEGIVLIVDELGGIDVEVPEKMNDSNSGARFEKGWHHMNGRQVLAFSRNRHISGGDFTRSANQGRVIVAALDKLRAEVSDYDGIRRWVQILFHHARVDMSMDEAVSFGGLARSIDPAGIVQKVAPGTAQDRNGQSVVILSQAAYELFRDIGADAVADGRTEQAPAPAPPNPTPAPTPAPTPVPASPKPSESPTPVLPI